jgi:hypothetical protein
MLCLLHLLSCAPKADLLLLSAMISNGDAFAAWVQAVSEKPCTSYMDLWKPSRQARGIVVYDELDPGLRQQRPTPYGLFGLHQLWNPRAPADTRIVKLCDKPVTLGRSATGRLTPNANDVAARLAYDAAAARVKSIVFVQQAGHAPSTASKVARWHDALTALPEKEQALWNDIVARNAVGPSTRL